MYKIKKLWLPGYSGMVGSALLRKLTKLNIKVLKTNSKNLDLLNYNKVFKFIKKNKPDTVILSAAKVGGIYANNTYPADFIFDNLKIQINVLDACRINRVKKLLFIGSSCIYPKNSKQPIKEEYLLSSFLEESNEGYALAKISTLKYCEYIKFFLKKDFISLQPTNLYGERDNFDLSSSHVIPALIRKFHNSKKNNKNFVEVWGSGLAKREFMHVKDLAEAIYFCLNKKINHSFMNIGSGNYVSIRNLAELIKKITNYKGKIYYNKKYPDGVLKRSLDVTRIKKLGWYSKISLEDGLQEYYEYFKKLNLE